VTLSKQRDAMRQARRSAAGGSGSGHNGRPSPSPSHMRGSRPGPDDDERLPVQPLAPGMAPGAMVRARSSLWIFVLVYVIVCSRVAWLW
jgi:hypothetical protein